MKNKNSRKRNEGKGKSILKVLLMVLLLFTFYLSPIHAQEAIPATGGNASGIGGSVSYSVGQVVYTTITGTTGSVAQGVQQPFEISVVAGIEESKGITLQCSAYPNPVTEYLQLKVESNDNFYLSTLTYSLYDIGGKLLDCKKVESIETSIVMSNLVSSTYFLKVFQNNKEVKTFKIIKN